MHLRSDAAQRLPHEVVDLHLLIVVNNSQLRFGFDSGRQCTCSLIAETASFRRESRIRPLLIGAQQRRSSRVTVLCPRQVKSGKARKMRELRHYTTRYIGTASTGATIVPRGDRNSA
jgi:hypothetical protein